MLAVEDAPEPGDLLDPDLADAADAALGVDVDPHDEIESDHDGPA